LDQIKSLLSLFETSQRMADSRDPRTLLDTAVQGVARALGADQCAIAFPEDHEPNQMRLVAIHNPTRQGRTEEGVFPLEYQFAITQAMRRKSHVLVEDLDNLQLKTLFSLLGSSQTGPLLVQPLLSPSGPAGGEFLGALIVGNACSQRPFTPNDAKLCQVMADHIVTAIQNLERSRVVQDKIAEVTAARIESLRAAQIYQSEAREQADRLSSSQAEADALRQARDALEIKLLGSRAEADTLARRVAALEQELMRSRGSDALKGSAAPIAGLAYGDATVQGELEAVSPSRYPEGYRQTAEMAPARFTMLTTSLGHMQENATSIISYADLLLSEAMGTVGDAQRKYLLRIKSGAEQLANRIRELTMGW
jgi:GAF domain-containing protein